MKTKLLGQGKRNKRFSDWHEFPDLLIPMLGIKVAVIVDGEEDPNEIDQVVANILKLNGKDRIILQGHLYKNYQATVKAIGQEDAGCEIERETEVWNHCALPSLRLTRRPYGNLKLYAQFAGGCDWEEEHGLTVSYLEGAILARVSQHDGHLTYTDAYDVPEAQDRIDG